MRGLQKLAGMADTRVAELNRDLEAQQQAATEKSRELEDASDQVASGDVRSPVDGYVVARKGQVGDEVTIEVQDLFQIAVNVAQLKVVLEPPPPALAMIRAGQDAIIQIAELSDAIESKVTEVLDGQVTIEFTSPNPVHQAWDDRPGGHQAEIAFKETVLWSFWKAACWN